jgi:modification methylase
MEGFTTDNRNTTRREIYGWMKMPIKFFVSETNLSKKTRIKPKQKFPSRVKGAGKSYHFKISGVSTNHFHQATFHFPIYNDSTMKLPLDQVIHGDCRDVLTNLPPESVDLIFADPPYNLQLQNDLWRPNHTKVDAVDEAWDQFKDFADYDAFTRQWLEACRHVLKATGTLWVIGTYHNIHRVGTILQDLGFWTLNEISWIKTNPMPNFRGVRFTNAHETLLWVQKERRARYTFNHHAMKSLNGDKQMRSDWVLPLCTGQERLRVNGEKAHPTQKPEALLYRVITASSNPGDVVLDPFFGTGTTGAVAKQLHRRWIGIEQGTAYVEISRERIEKIDTEIFDPEVFITPNPRRLPRIPFGRLVETGLLHPGQALYFRKEKEKTARVLSDGTLEYNNQRGSIHKFAKEFTGAPANGWELWYYEDKTSNALYKIDRLRQQIREGAFPEKSGYGDK